MTEVPSEIFKRKYFKAEQNKTKTFTFRLNIKLVMHLICLVYAGFLKQINITLRQWFLKLRVATLFRVINFIKRVAKFCQQEYYTIKNDQPGLK